MGKGEARSLNKRLKICKIINLKIENFEIAKSCLGSLRVQQFIVFMSLHDSSASYLTSKKGLLRDLSKMPEAITRWPLLVELQYWLSRLQRVRLSCRQSFRFLWNMMVLIFEIFGRFVLECPSIVQTIYLANGSQNFSRNTGKIAGIRSVLTPVEIRSMEVVWGQTFKIEVLFETLSLIMRRWGNTDHRLVWWVTGGPSYPNGKFRKYYGNYASPQLHRGPTKITPLTTSTTPSFL